jgi:hypothetical protein
MFPLDSSVIRTFIATWSTVSVVVFLLLLFPRLYLPVCKRPWQDYQCWGFGGKKGRPLSLRVTYLWAKTEIWFLLLIFFSSLFSFILESWYFACFCKCVRVEVLMVSLCVPCRFLSTSSLSTVSKKKDRWHDDQEQPWSHRTGGSYWLGSRIGIMV